MPAPDTTAGGAAAEGGAERVDVRDIGGIIGAAWRLGQYEADPARKKHVAAGRSELRDAIADFHARALADPAAAGVAVPADLVAYLNRQWAWSKETFGPALRTKGVVQHIRKELVEIEAEPHDLAEWVDVIILAMDGFWRHGGKPEALLPAMQAKQDRNFARTWPDWRTMGEDQAIEHDRSQDAAPAPAAPGGRGDAHRGMPIATDDPGYHCPRCGLDDAGIRAAAALIERDASAGAGPDAGEETDIDRLLGLPQGLHLGPAVDFVFASLDQSRRVGALTREDRPKLSRLITAARAMAHRYDEARAALRSTPPAGQPAAVRAMPADVEGRVDAQATALAVAPVRRVLDRIYDARNHFRTPLGSPETVLLVSTEGSLRGNRDASLTTAELEALAALARRVDGAAPGVVSDDRVIALLHYLRDQGGSAPGEDSRLDEWTDDREVFPQPDDTINMAFKAELADPGSAPHHIVSITVAGSQLLARIDAEDRAAARAAERGEG